MNRKRIIILGAGFGGLRTALRLSKLFSKKDVEIILVDRNSYQTYTPALYEVATAYRDGDLSVDSLEENNFKEQISSAIAFDIRSIISKTNIQFITDQVIRINTSKQEVVLKRDGSTPYDYCVVALGSKTAYFSVEGARENALSLKSLRSSLLIRDKVRSIVKKVARTGKPSNITVIGAGLSGVEVATELSQYLKHLVKQSNVNKDDIHISLIEAQKEILSMCSDRMCKKANKRLKNLKVELLMSKKIVKVKKSEIIFNDKSVLKTDLVIWSGGIQCNYLKHIVKGISLFSKKGQLMVSEHLNLYERKNVFAIGDCAFFQGAPDTAYIAEQQADIAAKNIYSSEHKEDLVKYKVKKFGFVSSAGGKYAIADLGFICTGYMGWCIKRFIDLKYIISIHPLTVSILIWYSNIRLFSKND